MHAAGWQKLTPAGGGTSPSNNSLNVPSSTHHMVTTYTSQHSNDGSVNGMAQSRSIPWPRNCFRFILYGLVFLTITGMFGFFIGQRPTYMPSTIQDDQVAAAVSKQRIDVLSYHKKSKLFPEPTLQELLSKERIPNIVHFIWCEPGYFEFKHYVSVQSAIKIVRPDLIIFHLTSEPTIDDLGYNDWWDRLKKNTQNLIIHRVAADVTTNCTGDAAAAKSIFDKHVRTQGGIYIAATGVVLASPIDLKLDANLDSVSYDFPKAASGQGVLSNLPAVLLTRPKSPSNAGSKLEPTSSCLFPSEFDTPTAESAPICVISEVSSAQPLYPRDIWEAPTQFGKLYRALAYDTDDILAPTPQPATLIPMICHYLWLGGGTLDFLLYLSILSCLNVLKADAVLIHGEVEPEGALWKELLAMGDSRLSYVYRPQQVTMYGTPVKKLAAMSDVLRTDILLKYGGIYTDWDAIWVRPLDVEIRSYDAVVAPDWPSKLKPFPATLNLGVMLAKPGSAYVKHLQEGMADYADGVGPLEWCFICLRAYKVLEKYPNTARLEPRLQVMGYLGRYHPVWQAGAGDDTFDGTFDWKTETYAVHWTFPTPKELRSKPGLVRANSTAADIARYILKTSGISTS